MLRKSYVVVDLEKLKSNAKAVKELSGHDFMYAVVKANGYGHGAIHSAKAFIEGGATHLAVATLQEAIDLRKELSEIPILVMGYVDEEYFEIAAKFAITLTLTNVEQIEFLKSYSGKLLKVHLKVDTGMNRIGFKDAEIVKKSYSVLKYNDYVEVEGMFTHFASSTGSNDKLYHHQYEMFKNLAEEMDGLFKYVHAQNSGAIVNPPGDFSFCNTSRAGIILYGYNPGISKELKINVQQAISLYSHVSHVKKITSSDHVGYNGTFKPDGEMYIATLPIGYADGVIRANQGRKVYIENIEKRIVGTVCMDQIMIEADSETYIGQAVELIGENITTDEVAEYLNTISYEVVCTLSNRLPRVYVNGDEVLDTISFHNIDKKI